MKPFLMMTLLFALTTPAWAAWYEGGSLAGSTIAQWKKAPIQDKVATASSWASGTPYISARLKRWKRPEPYMQHARRLVDCIDFTTGVTINYDQQLTFHFAKECMENFGWYERSK